MQLARLVPEQHSQVRCAVLHCLFQLRNRLNISKFGLRTNGIVTRAPAEPFQDIPSLLLAAHFDQPARGLGKEPDDGKQNEEEDNLEGDREAPAKGRFAAINEGESAILCQRYSPFDPLGRDTYNSSQ